MTSKTILLATAIFSTALSVSALADSYYFRSKGSPTSSIPGDSENDGEEIPPENAATVAIGFVADKYRAGATISGTLDTSLANPVWSFEQTPTEPAIGFMAVEGGVTATASAVEDTTTFQVSATATEDGQSSSAEAAALTIYPVLSISGGPSGEIKGDIGSALDAQSAYVVKGLAETPTYTLMQSSARITDFEMQCPGLTFSTTDGKISGTPTEACSLQNLSVKVKDSFDEAETTSVAFSITIEPAPSNVLAWGRNNSGQLGDGTTTPRLIPARVLGGKTYLQVAAGTAHACGIVDDGTVECWGTNAYGQLGDGTKVGKLTPVQVSGLSGVTAIAAGSYSSCAVASGNVMCWGRNTNGQLGNGTTIDTATPVQVAGLSDVTTISAGGYTACAVVAGLVECWGKNAFGQLGDGTTVDKSAPVQVARLHDVTAIAVSSGNHICAVSSGNVMCLGNNSSGQLGDGTKVQRRTPVQVPGLSGVTAIAGGNPFTCAVAHNVVQCWGVNNSGQLGDGTTADKSTPVQVTGLSNVTAISAGVAHTCTIDGGIAKCWGYGAYGQLGNGLTVNSLIPAPVQGVSNISRISAGDSSTYAW